MATRNAKKDPVPAAVTETPAAATPVVDADAEAKKAAAKKEAEEKAAAKKAEAEKAKAERAAKREADKTERKAKKDAEKAEREAARAANTQNGVRRPNAAGKCGQAWALMDQLGEKKGGAPHISEIVPEAEKLGLNLANVRAEYARWKQFYGIKTEDVVKPAKPEAAPAAPAAP